MNNQGCVAEKKPAITKAFERLLQVTDECASCIQALEGRISPILKLLPTVAGESPKRPSTDVQLADAINDLSDKIAHIRDHAQDITARVEL